uniref:Uncharacterized protein n=1 Tax=Astyanax mexicanus TaxID=7994 RepID=A0A8B9RNS1_ASTMX
MEELVQLIQGLVQRVTPPVAEPAAAGLEQPVDIDAPANPPSSSVFIAVPERYDGSPGSCKSFLMQCTLYINHNAAQFRREADKIYFVISLLTGKTLKFLIIESPDHPVILGYSWLAQHDPLISWKQGEILK